MNKELTLFEGYQIRRHYDEATETWWFSVVDIIRVLTQQSDHRKALSYWTTLKNRLKGKGSKLVTNRDQLIFRCRWNFQPVAVRNRLNMASFNPLSL